MKINFFPVEHLPSILPFWTRTRDHRDPLAEHERLLNPDRARESTERPVVFVGDANTPLSEYARSNRSYHQVPPRIVLYYILVGLAQFFRKQGLRVIVPKFGLRCYNPAHELTNELVPRFIQVLRGVEIQPDFIGIGDDRIFGFFVTTRALIEFRAGLGDRAVAEAAHNARVAFKMNCGQGHGRLARVDHKRSIAAIQLRDREIEIPLDRVSVPGNSKIVARYCDLVQKPDAARRVYVAGQIANFRVSASGKRERRWLARQDEHVRKWLYGMSRADSVRFNWPWSEHQLTFSCLPKEARKST